MKKYALCIGNNNYSHLSKLECAVADAEDVHEKLIALGFDSELFLDLDLVALEKRLSNYSDRLEEYDVGLLYYAGHGFQVNNDNLLVPIDYLDPGDEKLARRHAFPLDDLMRWLDKYPNKTKIIVLDACRNMYGSRGAGNNFVPIMAPQGSIIAFSTSSGQTANERNGHGIYTKCLLDHIDDPHVSIETMFKRVRTDLVRGTNGKQIPWEHTSLIGDFQLNPNSVYDTQYYSQEALADGGYIFDRNSVVKPIVEEMKKNDFYIQRDALMKVYDINYDEVIANDLFVLGRNIYQAACGMCYACRTFIGSFLSVSRIPIKAKGHILNGMVFEIYYDRYGIYRTRLKNDYAEEVIRVVESEPFLSTCEFISSKLLEEDRDVYYIPGQNQKTIIKVRLIDDENTAVVKDILFNAHSIFKMLFGWEVPSQSCEGVEKERLVFEEELRKKMTIMPGYQKIIYEGIDVDSVDSVRIPMDEYTFG